MVMSYDMMMNVATRERLCCNVASFFEMQHAIFPLSISHIQSITPHKHLTFLLYDIASINIRVLPFFFVPLLD